MTKARKSNGKLIASALVLRERSDFLLARSRFSPDPDSLGFASFDALEGFDDLAVLAELVAFVAVADLVDFLALVALADPLAADFLGASALPAFLAALVARRLTGPRTGTRAT